MGSTTCCNGRSAKSPPKKVPKSKTKPTVIEVTSVDLDSEPSSAASIGQPKALIENVTSLKSRASHQLSLLLEQNKSIHSEFGLEQMQGYLKLSQVISDLDSRKVLFVFSNYAVYLLDQLDFQLLYTCDILHILLITLAPDRISAILHQTSNEMGDVWLLDQGIEGLLHVLETCYYEKRNKYLCTYHY